jgi:mRNA interferase MazF
MSGELSDADAVLDPAGYVPDAGDLIWIDRDPRDGREQSGRRPALVVSPAAFFIASGFAIVGHAIAGEILTSHVRSIDTLARPIVFSGSKVPLSLLGEVRAKLAALIGYTS